MASEISRNSIAAAVKDNELQSNEDVALALDYLLFGELTMASLLKNLIHLYVSHVLCFSGN